MKDENLTEEARELRQKHLDWALKSFDKYKTKMLKSGEKDFDYHSKDMTLNDNFFVDGEEDKEEVKEQKRAVKRIEVDKRGNVLKRK